MNKACIGVFFREKYVTKACITVEKVTKSVCVIKTNENTSNFCLNASILNRHLINAFFEIACIGNLAPTRRPCYEAAAFNCSVCVAKQP